MHSPYTKRDVQRAWPLVGREAERDACEAALSDPSCNGVVIRGSAGVGKTRLATHVWERALAAGHQGSRATATAAAGTIPFGALAHLLPDSLDFGDAPAAFHAARAAFVDRSGRSFALFVDDVNLLDASSATLIGQLLDMESIFLIATLRSDVMVSDAVLAIDRTEGMAHVDLHALSQDEVEGVLTTVLGGVVERKVVCELHRLSEGNLLFLRELVLGMLGSRALVPNGGVWRAPGQATGPLRTARLSQLIRTRLKRYGAQGTRTLETLAVAGPMGVPDLIRATSAEAFFALEEADLIHVHVSRRRMTATLAHPLYGEILLESVPVSRRVHILGECEQSVLAHGAKRLEDVLRIATWQLGARGTADPHLIVEAAMLARHSHDYVQVVDLLEALPPSSVTEETMLQLGEAYYLLHRFDDSERLLERAYATAGTEAERLRLAIERTQNLFWGAARVADALQVNRQASEATGDAQARASLRANEGAMLVFSGRTDDGLGLLDEVDGISDERVRLYACAMKALGLSAAGRTQEAVALAGRTYAEHAEASKRIIIQHPAAALSVLSLSCMAAGDLAGAQRAAERGHRQALADNATQPAAWLSYDLGRTAWLQGRIRDARRWFAETLELSLGDGILVPLRPAAAGLAAADAVLGRTDEADALAADLAGYPDVFFLPGEQALGKAWALAARGHTTAACEVLSGAAEQARKAGAASSELLLLTDAARLGAASQVLDRMERLEQRCDGAFASPSVRFARAHAAQDGEGLLRAAGELEEIGALLMAAEAAAAAANAFRRAGDPRRATSALHTSAELARSCQGAVTPGLLCLGSAASLSAREREIASLATTGITNKQIADELHLSTRTVENHLQRVYAKLGIVSRRELATKLTPRQAG
ncbi:MULTISPECIES: helix-turn-helix transcriptional regulator [unclassified Streptomyces]|uniref:helix-turn-helix transcriptional regulator n=1 Tax=unclassified Streptomyces TaxID=2593676 RepID=UPI0004BE058E|nr:MULTISPECIES: LuxR family transcriptional regulator [unclassified Streptomyces]